LLDKDGGGDIHGIAFSADDDQGGRPGERISTRRVLLAAN
jgi:hypothetical protein